MTKFIEVHDTNGVCHLINTKWIEDIIDDGGCWVYLSFNAPNYSDQNYIYTTESYNQIKSMILG